jgi:metallo-beta-lactamase family protein
VEHEQVEVRAKIDVIGSYSAHADGPKLMRWVTEEGRPKLVILNHGEQPAREAVAAQLKERGIAVAMPMMGESIEC